MRSVLALANRLFLCFFSVLWLSSLAASAQETPHRLILKDGSYQLITKYEIKGDRVHYYSSEREEWEDLPKSLVDWPATEKFEKEISNPPPEAVQLDKEAEHEHDAEETPLPEVAPGLRLPEDSGVFLLDTFQGQPQIVELQQNAGDVNRNTKGNILRGAVNPIASMKLTIELDGAHASMQSHVPVPSLYINVDSDADTSPRVDQKPQPQQPEQPEKAIVPFDRFRILRAEVKNGKRIVGDVKRSPTGKMSQEQHFVKTTIDRISGGWFKVTPSEPLDPGEYALVEMMGKEGMNLGIWDFGVNPKAAANANPWKPEVKQEKKPAPAVPQTESH